MCQQEVVVKIVLNRPRAVGGIVKDPNEVMLEGRLAPGVTITDLRQAIRDKAVIYRHKPAAGERDLGCVDPEDATVEPKDGAAGGQ